MTRPGGASPRSCPSSPRELGLLRRPIGVALPALQGPVARRMAEAVWPYRRHFITPMAAVAGAVAEEMLAALTRGRDLARAYVNDGGDIALHLAPGERFGIGIVAELAAPGHRGPRRDRGQRCGARHRHQRSRRAQLQPRHRRCGDGAGAPRRRGRCRRHHDRQCRRPRSSRGPAPPGLEPRSRQRSGRLPGDRRRRRSVVRSEVAAALELGAMRAMEYGRAGLILAAMLQLRGDRRIVSTDGYSHPQVSRHR